MDAAHEYQKNRDYAVRLARHYLRYSFNHEYQSDQDAEMALLVDALIDAAVAKAAMLKEQS